MKAFKQRSVFNAALLSFCLGAGTLFVILHLFKEKLDLKVNLIDMFVIKALSFAIVTVTIIAILTLIAGGIRISLEQLICQVKQLDEAHLV